MIESVTALAAQGVDVAAKNMNAYTCGTYVYAQGGLTVRHTQQANDG